MLQWIEAEHEMGHYRSEAAAYDLHRHVGKGVATLMEAGQKLFTRHTEINLTQEV
jgi:hypothetical protein